MPFLPVSLLLRDRWDNAAALSKYAGRIDIYGALQDTIIPVNHARQLAQALPRATYHEVDCGHNDWSSRGHLRLVNDLGSDPSRSRISADSTLLDFDCSVEEVFGALIMPVCTSGRFEATECAAGHVGSIL